MNNAGVSGIQVDGDVRVFQEFIEADIATIISPGGKVCFPPTSHHNI